MVSLALNDFYGTMSDEQKADLKQSVRSERPNSSC